MVQKIVPIINRIEHTTYVEVFGGGASILFGKRPSRVEVYNDIDQALYDFFTLLQDKDLFQEFHRLCQVTPYSRQIFNECRREWKQETDKLKRVYKWYVMIRQSFGGSLGASWGFERNCFGRNMSLTVSRWLGAITGLPEVHNRFMSVQVDCLDFRKIFKNYDTPETLFYCDPPYTEGSRKGSIYTYELLNQDHQELVDILLNLKGKVLLSGYPTELYLRLNEAGWYRYEWKTFIHFTASKYLDKSQSSRTECLWCSPNTKVQKKVITRRVINGN